MCMKLWYDKMDSVAHAQSIIKKQMLRTLSVTAIRTYANPKLNRIPYIDGSVFDQPHGQRSATHWLERRQWAANSNGYDVGRNRRWDT